MRKRRSLNEALELSPEALEFINQGNPDGPAEDSDPTTRETPTRPAEATPVSRKKTEPHHRAEENEELSSVNSSDDDQASARSRPRRSRRRRSETPAPAELDMLVPLTTRIQRSTSKALIRAYLQQKLDGQIPATQQAIVEEALTHWLKTRGFL